MFKTSKVRKKPGKDLWAVYSKKGKKISKWYKSKKKAMKRLRQIEYFKHNSADDHVSDLLDFINHNTYGDVLTTKPPDANVVKYNSLKKKSFGLPQPGANSAPGSTQAPNYDEDDSKAYNMFFSGDSDPENIYSDSGDILPKQNYIDYDNDLKELIESLEAAGEQEEADRVKKLI